MVAFGCDNEAKLADEVLETNIQLKSVQAKNSVAIYIEVDTDKLLKEYPKGGDITNSGIVEMTQEGGSFYYKNGQKDQLVTETVAGASIQWKIESKNRADNLTLLNYLGDDKMSKMFINNPVINSYDKSVFNARVRETMPNETVSTYYFVEFSLEKQPDIIWSWDPDIICPFPPK